MRLNTDYIDIYAIHYRDGKTPLGDVVDTLEYLKNAVKSDISVFQIYTVKMKRNLLNIKISS